MASVVVLHVLLLLDSLTGVSPAAQRHAVAEVERLWRRHHVQVSGVVGRCAPDLHAVVVVAVRSAALRVPLNGVSRPLGLIDFDEYGAPQPVIVVNTPGLLQLVHGLSHTTLRELYWPQGLRDRTTGRVLGRVLAHELGHFLLAKKRHSRSGLMRADHSITQLAASSESPYDLEPADRARLETRIAAR
jgi:hypothetical protein